MALSLGSSSSQPTTDKKKLFVEDDEEIWKTIVSFESNADENDDNIAETIGPLLSGLASRLQEDWQIGNSDSAHELHWKTITTSVSKATKGVFSYSDAASSKTTSNAASSSSTSDLPAAFQTSEGKNHLEATQALLGLSQDRALQVTMGALRSVDTTSSSSNTTNENFSSLVGTRELLTKTQVYHYRQRDARVSVVTECIRLAQDPSCPLRRILQTHVLDPLEKTHSSSGLFKNLLILSSLPDPVATRTVLEPSKNLTHSSNLNSSSSNKINAESSLFASKLFSEVVAQAMQERTLAMEGLLALLYQRGISRSEYALLLTALFLETSGANDNRWDRLAGLVSAECTTLWRAIETSVGWTEEHPLLEGLVGGSGLDELQALALFLLQIGVSDSSRGPQSLAHLSFGLLLRLASADVMASKGRGLFWTNGALSELLFSKKEDDEKSNNSNTDDERSLEEYGLEFVNLANNTAGVFDFLIETMTALTGDPLSDVPSLAVHDALYDWQFTRASKRETEQVPMLTDMAHTGNSVKTLSQASKKVISADLVTYTSIAREIVAAAIAMEENLLAIDQEDSCQNIGMLTRVAVEIYRNNEPLCAQFWDTWEIYSTNNDGFPMCSLLDASHNMARDYLAGWLQGLQGGKLRIDKEELVSACGSFLSLFSVLCHNRPKVAESAIEMLPPNLIRMALECCCCEPSSSFADGMGNRLIVVESLERLARTSSESCLSTLRQSFEGDAMEDGDGPRVLATILFQSNKLDIARAVLGLIANLLEGAPKNWAALMASQFIDTSASGSATSRLIPFLSTNKEPLSRSAVMVLAELIGHMNAFVFGSKEIEEDPSVSSPRRKLAIATASSNNSLSLLQSLGEALLTAMTGLATTQISTASVETAEIVFQSFANFLKWIRPIIHLHECPRVREGAIIIRDTLIQTLANSNGFGEVLVYYATAPVSLALVAKMEETVLDQSIAEQVAKEDDSEAAKPYGAWYSLSSGYKGHSSGASLSKSKVLDFLGKMKASDFDLEDVQARGWVRSSNANGVAALDASRSSIRLLSEWASHAEDIAKSHLDETSPSPLHEKAKEVLVNLSPQRLLCTAAPMPIPCQADSRLSSLWQSLERSTLDFLLPYLDPKEESGKDEPGLAASVVLNLLNACIAHATLTEAKMADSVLLRTIVQSNRFATLLKDIVERGIRLAKESDGKLPSENEADLLSTFVGLQILSSCVSASPAVANAVLGLEKDSGLTTTLIEGALFAPKVLDLNGSREIFSTDGSILQMRIAAGCVAVLSELWKSVGFLSTVSSADPVASALRKTIDGQSAFLTALSDFVSDYANSNNLDNRINVSHETEFGRVSTMNALTSAFEILASAHVHEASTEAKTSSTSGILSKFSKCRRLLRAETYAMSVTSTKQIWDMTKYAGLEYEVDSLSFLSSFPATSNGLQVVNFYRNENAFDLLSLVQWLTCNGIVAGIAESDALDKASLLHHLTASELRLMQSWKQFLEITMFHDYFSNDCVMAGSSLQIAKNMTHDTLYSLKANLASGAASQTGFSTDFMRGEICQMSSCLSDLFLFQLEIGAFDLLPLDELLEIARSLSDAMKSLQDIACPDPTKEIDGQNDRLKEYCIQQQSLLSCALVVCGLIEKREHSRPDQGVQGEIYTSLCMTNCTFLRAFSRICTKETIRSKMHRNIIRSSASLLTLLVIGYMGDQSSDSSYTIALSQSFREYEVLQLLMQYATYLSSFVGINLSSANALHPSEEDIEILEVIKAVFNLVHSIADTNDPEMISTLHVAELSQLAVRNPLFNLRSHLWSQQDTTRVQPRGYVFKREMVKLSNQKSSIYVGSEDPVYEIWLTSMQVLGACVRTSSHYLLNTRSGVDGPGTGFIDMSVEFLRVYKTPLLVCLNSCVNPSKMTRFALREAKVLLAMVAELCKRNVRTSLVGPNLQLCDEFVEQTKILMTSLSKFLGASGTSSELFATIEEYETSDQDRFEDQLKSAPLSQLRQSLLSIGLPMAKQKAMRLSNYASSRLEKISQEDFEGVAVVPDHLKSLSEKRTYESESERICRLAVTNKFSLDLVRASAECVSQALSLVLRTHAMSKSFYMFSEADRAIDIMNLVEPGIVIGYWPNAGRSMLFDSKGFELLRFGRVLSVDTFSRTWEVEVIRQEEANHLEALDGRKETVGAVQLAGMEDKSARKASTSLPSPAPDDMTAFENAPGFLTIGNYIMILRWCHQQSTFALSSSSLDAGFHTPSYIRQIAEQASILLGADLVFHGLTGSFQNKDQKKMSQLDRQLFELFADKVVLTQTDNLENQEPIMSFANGRLQKIIDKDVWNGLQAQVAPFVQRAWKGQQELERKNREKQRNTADNTEFFSGFRRPGKSSFRR